MAMKMFRIPGEAIVKQLPDGANYDSGVPAAHAWKALPSHAWGAQFQHQKLIL